MSLNISPKKPCSSSSLVSGQYYYDAAAKEAELRAQSTQWNTSNPKPARDGDIPIIDISKWFETGSEEELNRLGVSLREACETVGFYQLVGHGLPLSLTNGILQLTRRFHALPTDVKSKIPMDRKDHPLGGVGYLGYGNRKLPSRDTDNKNAAFIVKADHQIDLFRDNQWLEEGELEGFHDGVSQYADEMTNLGKKMLPVYATAFKLRPDYFDEAFQKPFYRLRMSHYPAIPTNESSEKTASSFGISPHVDTSFFTLLLTDGTPGLCIFSHPRNEWIQVPILAQENALIVNSGELLRQWSNDTFLSVRHFVTNPTGEKDRYSVPFFFNANSDYKMECLPTCQSPDKPPKYPPFSYNESQGVVQGE